jgi:hypothetical protein
VEIEEPAQTKNIFRKPWNMTGVVTRRIHLLRAKLVRNVIKNITSAGKKLQHNEGAPVPFSFTHCKRRGRCYAVWCAGNSFFEYEIKRG